MKSSHIGYTDRPPAPTTTPGPGTPTDTTPSFPTG